MFCCGYLTDRIPYYHQICILSFAVDNEQMNCEYVCVWALKLKDSLYNFDILLWSRLVKIIETQLFCFCFAVKIVHYGNAVCLKSFIKTFTQ